MDAIRLIEPHAVPRTCAWQHVPRGVPCDQAPMDGVYTAGVDSGHHFVAWLCREHIAALYSRSSDHSHPSK